MKAISAGFAAALLSSALLSPICGAAHAQMTKGGPAEAKQYTSDPMIKEPTADQLRRNPGLARHDRGPTNGRIGGPPGETRMVGNSGQ